MISHRLFLFIERVVAAKMDIVVQGGIVCLGATGSRWSRAVANDLNDQLTDDIKAEIVEVFVRENSSASTLPRFWRQSRRAQSLTCGQSRLGREASRVTTRAPRKTSRAEVAENADE